jgi:signal transduction histidine kinase
MIPREEELIYRTRWLVRVRWFVVLLMGVGAGLSGLLGLAYPVVPLFLVAGFVAVYNVLFSVSARWTVGRRPELQRVYRFINIQIATDFVALLAWVHYTGGPTSPFLPFFVFHLVICGLLVSLRMMLVHAAWVCFALVAMGVAETQRWIEHWPALDAGVIDPMESRTYLLSIAAVIIITFLTISVLVGGIARRLRRREFELNDIRYQLELHTREVEAAHAKLKDLDDERSAFFRLVSHQLRSPLASIQTVLKLVTGGYSENAEKTAELVSRAEVQSQHMLALLNDMLSLTRLKEMADTDQAEAIALGPLVADVVEEAQTAAQHKQITLTADIDPDLPSISGVRNQILQLFAALVQNAVKYTPEGGTVTVTAEYNGGEARIAVKDTGIGIAPEDQRKIFDEFYRAANARLYEAVGTGLGLSIAHKVAQDLGGRIEIESTAGQGSTFTVVLPLPAMTA